ncbi:hypothetical protein F4808DRAFT_315231 [Astrocystis sublimbata]|nr:hypothetical protein F4808DRAFT_315231 [Astrocystis sublimbata]
MSRDLFFYDLRTSTIRSARQSYHRGIPYTIKETMTADFQEAAPPRRRQNPAHAPPNPEDNVYVLTLKTDAAHQQRMSELRRRYFPAHLLKVDAHITLFHALPHSSKSAVISDISSLCAATAPSSIRAAKPFRMGRGVGVHVTGLEPVGELCREMQTRWWEHLTQQDQRRFKGHYTLMNKVDDKETVEKCLEELESGFEGCEGRAIGLDLWRYDRGWWRHERDFEFKGTAR